MRSFWRRTQHSLSVLVPVAIAVAAVGVILPVAGSPTSAAAEVNLFAWGENSYGILGTGNKVSSALPVMVKADGVLAGTTVTAASIAEYHGCAVASGAAYCWGYNPDGRVGDGTNTEKTSPVAVTTAEGVLAGKTVTDITAGTTHSCAVADGRVYCWGTNSFGELGRAGGASRVPVAVNTSGVLSGKTVVKVRAGRLFTCALTNEPALYCWGYNYFGQLGNNSTTDSAVPVAVNAAGALLGKTVTDFGVSKSGLGYHACAIANGAAFCWGANSTGQLGNNSFTSSSVPVAVDTSAALSGKTVTSIAPGNGFTCAVANGAAYCWGDNSGNGMLGTGGGSTKVPAAVSTAGVLSGKTIAQIATGPSSACVRAIDDAMACWGATSYVISGGPNSSSTPVAVVTTGSGIVGKRIRSIEFGTTGMLAITASPPAVTSVSPSSGPASGGTPITITGTDFATSGTTSVTVGGVECGSVAVASSTSISCTTGAGTAGAATVIVTFADGQTATKASAFTYVDAPTLTGATPSGRPPAGGDLVTITGTGFATSGTVGVTIGGQDCTSVSVSSSTSLSCTTPAGSLGAAEVVVTNPDGQSASNSSIFAFAAAPSVSDVSPTVGPVAGGTPITISGADIAASGTVSVTVGGATCGSVQVAANSVTCSTPAGSPGAADVVLTNPDGQSTNLTDGFTFVPVPDVTDVTPSSGRASGGTTVTITGTDFDAAVVVTVGGNSCPIASATGSSITCTTPSGTPGAADVVVTNPADQSDTVTGGFTFVAAPDVTTVSPSSGPSAGGTMLTITGTGFATSGSVDVTLGGTPCGSVNVVSSSSIECISPAGSVGSVDVVVTNPDGQSDTSADGYSYSPTLVITDVSPRSARSIGGTTLTITGSGFATSGLVGVTVGGAACTGVSVSSATSLTCVTPAGTIGTATIDVTNPNGESASSSLFGYVATTASSLRYSGPLRIARTATSVVLSVQLAQLACWSGSVTFGHDADQDGSYRSLIGTAVVDAATGVASVAWTLPSPVGSILPVRAIYDGGDMCHPSVTTALLVAPAVDAPSNGAAVHSVPGVQRIGMAYVVGSSTTGSFAWEVPAGTRVIGTITRYQTATCPDQKPPIAKTAACAEIWGSGVLSDWDPIRSTWVQRASGVAFRVWVADGGFNIVKGSPAQARADWFRFDATSLDLVGESRTLTSIGADHITIR